MNNERREFSSTLVEPPPMLRAMSAVLRSLSFGLVLFILAASPLYGAGEDYAAKYKELHDKKAPDAEVEKLLDEWRAKDAGQSRGLGGQRE